MLAHTHVRVLSSLHPARRSSTTPAVAGAGRPAGRRSRARVVAETANVPASSANTIQGPIPATSIPASAGPTAKATLGDALIHWLACCRRPAGALPATSRVDAGPKNASPAP